MSEEEYEIKANMLLKGVPKKYRDGCKALAYQDGHLAGYDEMYIRLYDIVTTIFR